MTTPNKESTAATPRPAVDMDNPQDVARMLSSGYGLSGEGFHYHSFTRPVMLDVGPELDEPEDDTQHHLDDNITEYTPAPTAAPEPVAEPVHMPVAPPIIAEAAPPPPPPPPPPAPPPHTPVVTHVPSPPPVAPAPPVVETSVPEPVVEAAMAQAAEAPKPQPVPPQPAPAPERRGLQPFAAPRATSVPPASSRPAATVMPPVQADDWAPVPKAQQRRGQRPTGPGFFFAKGNDRVATTRLFQPVAVARPAPKPDFKVTTMTKFDKNAQNNPTGRRPAPSDNSPTLTEVFMTLGGRATDRLIPKPSLRDALLRKREEETGQS